MDDLLKVVDAPEHGASVTLRQRDADDYYEIQMRFDGCINIWSDPEAVGGGSPEENREDYMHVCNLPLFIKLLQEACDYAAGRWPEEYGG